MSGKKEFLVNGSAHNEIYSVEFDYNRDVLFWADQDTDSVMVGACWSIREEGLCNKKTTFRQ